MGQAEVCEFLERHKGIWFTAKEIASEIDADYNSSFLRVLQRMRKNRYVLYKQPKKNARQSAKYFVYKICE